MRFLTILSLLAVTRLAVAADAPPESPGQAMYLRYCGACHGPKAAGDGVAATGLEPKPTNLTLLAKQNGGQFPAARVTAFVDGTQRLPVHGSSEMPVWGEVFRADAPSGLGTGSAVRSTLVLITEYLRSVQTP